MYKYEFEYKVFSSKDELNSIHKMLLEKAFQVTQNAYAPYSQFKVGCSVLLENNQVLEGVNIENAAYPVGICAERSALSAAISMYPQVKILAIAISYVSPSGRSNQPVFPCGMCRQFIAEIEQHNNHPIPLILAGEEGKVILIEKAQHLLPFNFEKGDLK
ncbi:MAG: cytidine deaminase [Chitinophagaceae bacterium]|nr:MAG: zinc-binding CMP/dCMP deaminase [Bacteroidetes bacterium OLB11]MCC6448306.1 cytidine deaminase [Chitinophagaceae bacterium]HMN32448.1 cytidine deaminase [Chitinophagaceae bacterium]